MLKMTILKLNTYPTTFGTHYRKTNADMTSYGRTSG